MKNLNKIVELIHSQQAGLWWDIGDKKEIAEKIMKHYKEDEGIEEAAIEMLGNHKEIMQDQAEEQCEPLIRQMRKIRDIQPNK